MYDSKEIKSVLAVIEENRLQQKETFEGLKMAIDAILYRHSE